MRVLDLGCGFGKSLEEAGVVDSDDVVGIDLAFNRLQAVAKNFQGRRLIQARGELLPFRDHSFQSVVSLVSLPYMNIPAVLREAHRALDPGGTIHLSLHPLRFTIHELAVAFPRPKALLFRFWVIVNGLIFHLTGEPSSIGGRYESFQTRTGITLALRDAGFERVSISRPSGAFGRRLVVTAHKPPVW